MAADLAILWKLRLDDKEPTRANQACGVGTSRMTELAFLGEETLFQGDINIL
jgi:hypothetical protein